MRFIFATPQLSCSTMRAKHEHAKCEDTAHAADTQNQTDDVFRPVERGERGESFPGPRDVWGAAPSLKNTENGVPDGFFLT